MWRSDDKDYRRRFQEMISHWLLILTQYRKAIKPMEDSLSLGAQDIRTALIVCLLTVCFKSLNGDIQSAMAQVRSGIKLLKEW